MVDYRQLTPVQLRQSEHAVAESIWRLRQSAYGAEANLLQVTDFPPLRKSSADIASDCSRYFGIQAGSELLGLVELEAIEQREGEVTMASLLVDPVRHGQGIGSVLIAFVQALPGIRQIYVETAAQNKPALSLYQKMGFARLSTRLTSDGFELIRQQWKS